jgi:hypothetical protein
MEDMSRLRSFVFVASLAVVAAGGYLVTSSAHADRARSQDPRTWRDAKGHVDEQEVPDRIAMSSGDIDSGVVYIDPHRFYGELGADVDEGPVPVYDQREGGEAVGSFDLSTGDVTIDREHASEREHGRDGRRDNTTTTLVGASDDESDVTSTTVGVATDQPATGDTEPMETLP